MTDSRTGGEEVRPARGGHVLAAGLLGGFVALLAWSGTNPADRTTWWLEVTPAIVGVALLAGLYRWFRLTPLTCVLIWLHAAILLVGGHYTYAEVPLFNWLRDTLALSRNHFDRVGHFAQGFVPTIIAREVLLRASPLQPGKWLAVIVVCICLAISAAYEVLEWLSVVVLGSGAGDFLGAQGDVWDAQKDMALAFIGAICALLLLARWQDRQLRQVTAGRPRADQS